MKYIPLLLLLFSCGPDVEQMNYDKAQDSMIAAQNQRIDSLVVALEDLQKESRTDFYYTQKDLDYLWPRVQASDSFLLKESGRFGKWRKVGRALGYAKEAYKVVKPF